MFKIALIKMEFLNKIERARILDLSSDLTKYHIDKSVKYDKRILSKSNC